MPSCPGARRPQRPGRTGKAGGGAFPAVGSRLWVPGGGSPPAAARGAHSGRAAPGQRLDDAAVVSRVAGRTMDPQGAGAGLRWGPHSQSQLSVRLLPKNRPEMPLEDRRIVRVGERQQCFHRLGSAHDAHGAGPQALRSAPGVGAQGACSMRDSRIVGSEKMSLDNYNLTLCFGKTIICGGAPAKLAGVVFMGTVGGTPMPAVPCRRMRMPCKNTGGVIEYLVKGLCQVFSEFPAKHDRDSFTRWFFSNCFWARPREAKHRDRARRGCFSALSCVSPGTVSRGHVPLR